MSDYTRKRSTMTLKKSPEELLRKGIVIEIPVNGWSMYPLFVPGRDMAIITPFRESLTEPSKEDFPSVADVRRGDVVLFRRKHGILVLHRVYKVTDEEYHFAGDNTMQVERGITREQLIGILTGFIRNGREISTRNPVYRLLSHAWLWLRVPMRTVLNGAFRADRTKRK